MEMILSMVSIWAPSLVAILGIVASVVAAATKVKTAIAELKDDATIKEQTKEIQKLTAENKEIIRCNKLLLEQITKIKGYADAIGGEPKND